eukprot:766570-Hanusia_phi.AAC.5
MPEEESRIGDEGRGRGRRHEERKKRRVGDEGSAEDGERLSLDDLKREPRSWAGGTDDSEGESSNTEERSEVPDKRDHDRPLSAGITLKPFSSEIASLATFSSASLGRILNRGDTIIAVDGISRTWKETASLLERVGDPIGEKLSLLVARQHEQIHTHVLLSPKDRHEALMKLFDKLELLRTLQLVQASTTVKFAYDTFGNIVVDKVSDKSTAIDCSEVCTIVFAPAPSSSRRTGCEEDLPREVTWDGEASLLSDVLTCAQCRRDGNEVEARIKRSPQYAQKTINEICDMIETMEKERLSDLMEHFARDLGERKKVRSEFVPEEPLFSSQQHSESIFSFKTPSKATRFTSFKDSKLGHSQTKGEGTCQAKTFSEPRCICLETMELVHTNFVSMETISVQDRSPPTEETGPEAQVRQGRAAQEQSKSEASPGCLEELSPRGARAGAMTSTNPRCRTCSGSRRFSGFRTRRYAGMCSHPSTHIPPPGQDVPSPRQVQDHQALLGVGGASGEGGESDKNLLSHGAEEGEPPPQVSPPRHRRPPRASQGQVPRGVCAPRALDETEDARVVRRVPGEGDGGEAEAGGDRGGAGDRKRLRGAEGKTQFPVHGAGQEGVSTAVGGDGDPTDPAAAEAVRRQGERENEGRPSASDDHTLVPSYLRCRPPEFQAELVSGAEIETSATHNPDELVGHGQVQRPPPRSVWSDALEENNAREVESDVHVRCCVVLTALLKPLPASKQDLRSKLI